MSVVILAMVLVTQVDAETPRTWQDPSIAFEAATADAKRFGQQAMFLRYVHFPIADETLLRWHIYSVNECVSDLRNPLVVRPEVLAGGHLVRWDLRQLAPRIESDDTPDVFRLLTTWDQVFDATIYVQLAEPIQRNIATPRYQARDGKWYHHKQLARDHVPDALFEPHASQLMDRTFTNSPLVSVYEFQRHILTTLDGGLYYEFLDLPDTVDELLAKLGANRERIKQQRSDIKAVSVVSGVTNSPRRIIVLPGIQSRASENQGLIWITEDFIAARLDATTDPARNLHGETHDASEIIIERPNGGHIYYLANGQGQRQDSAPDFIATDTTILASGDRRLQPARSCVVCHSLNQARGIRDFSKDIQSVLQGNLDYAAERNTLDGEQFDLLQRTLGQYEWNPGKLLSRSRDDYSDFMIRATGTLQPEDIGRITKAFFHEYWESPVTAYQACLELGIPTDSASAAANLTKHIPPRAEEITTGYLAEDIYIAALCRGKPITRANYLQVVLEMRRRFQPEYQEP